VPADDPLTPAERLFAEAGYTRLQFLAWRVGTLPMLEVQAAIRALGSGWPADVLAEQRSEASLARRWIEQQRRNQAPETRPESASDQGDRKSYGPPLSSREAIELLEREVRELGKHHSIRAFEKALNRAAGLARDNAEELPVQLGGQHCDWQLVSLGSGGHRGAHVVRGELDSHHG